MIIGYEKIAVNKKVKDFVKDWWYCKINCAKIINALNKYKRGSIMKLLEERIRKDGVIKPGNVLKVDSFLNHQMDVELFNEMGKEFLRLFQHKNINKILTIEASGIGIACICAQHFHVPVVFAKKTQNLFYWFPVTALTPPKRQA